MSLSQAQIKRIWRNTKSYGNSELIGRIKEGASQYDPEVLKIYMEEAVSRGIKIPGAQDMQKKEVYLYIKINGELKGPCTKKQILQLYDANKINEDTIVGAAYGGALPENHTFVKLKDSQTYTQFNTLRTEHITLTTENYFGEGVIQSRLGIVTAECAYGMNLFRDFFAEARDIVGGRSKATQNILRDAKDAVLIDLKNEAHELGADAVIGVDLDYSEFSGKGKSMLFIVASGTAVKFVEGFNL